LKLPVQGFTLTQSRTTAPEIPSALIHPGAPAPRRPEAATAAEVQSRLKPDCGELNLATSWA